MISHYYYIYNTSLKQWTSKNNDTTLSFGYFKINVYATISSDFLGIYTRTPATLV